MIMINDLVTISYRSFLLDRKVNYKKTFLYRSALPPGKPKAPNCTHIRILFVQVLFTTFILRYVYFIMRPSVIVDENRPVLISELLKVAGKNTAVL